LLKRKKWLKAIIIFFVGVLWVGIHDSIFGFIGGFGADSFVEARSFDIDEAKFWLGTLPSILRFQLSAQLFGFYALLAFISCKVLIYIVTKMKITRKHYSYVTVSIASILIVGAIYQSVSKTVFLFLTNSENYEQTLKKFTNKVPSISVDQAGVDLLVYIGESTTVMNMGVYGYLRDTTPHLTELKDTDPNFLMFQNIFSTHTHTSPSLLEAFSFGLLKEDQYLPINIRRRISIVDVLKEGKITVDLYSNQGQTGSWNEAASIIFKNANRTFATESTKLGNSEAFLLKRPSDHEFFRAHITNKTIETQVSKKTLTIFHSYSGHGPYLLEDIMPDTFHQSVDQKLSKKNAKAIVGKVVDKLEAVESYDSTIKYIDFAIAEAIKTVSSSTDPRIFIYFSDHGESVFAKRGHDSSRFIHEMVRIPFIIYFNEASKRSRPDLYEKYSQLAKDTNVATLAQLPSTIFDLLGVELLDEREVIQLPIIGEKTSLFPIVVRETSKGITYVNLNLKQADYKLSNGTRLIDNTDEATKNFAVNTNNVFKNTFICYHRSNSLAKAIRGKLVSNCLEFDIMVDETNNIAVYHSSAKDSGLMLSDILELSRKGKQVALWLDGKNLQTKRTCTTLLNTLTKSSLPRKPLLIEFPSKSYLSKKEINQCVSELKENNFFTSYYVPTTEAINCSKKLDSGIEFEQESSCIALRKDLLVAKNSQLYTDFSFDYLGILAMEAISFTKELKWNTWNVNPEKYTTIQPQRFRMVILRNSDPNNL
jgi:glucan phosphoethanolaminetransferase (alkaline phosphatase superfamily)